MTVKVILFGQLADITGSSTLELEDVADTYALEQKIQTHFPALATAKYRVAVDKKIVTDNVSLNSNNTVALLPPFSGG